ncbi:MAG: LUD domain-containing protein [Bacteroidota bacterium]
MEDSTTREKILKKIRKALTNHRPQPYPNIDWESNVHVVSGNPLEETFAKEFTAIGGRFVFCENELDFLEQLVQHSVEGGWKKIFCYEEELCNLLEKVEFPFTREQNDFKEEMVAVTSCEALVARLGSVMISSKSQSGRRMVVVPTTHVIYAKTSQLVPDVKDALLLIKNKYKDQMPSFIASLAGPSRTADIEKTLVTPAHGPRDIFVFLIDDKGINSNI